MNASDAQSAKTGSPADAGEPVKLTWTEILADERRRIDLRRAWWAWRGTERLPSNSVGIALSGGGIRSATFSLGVLRALSRLGIMPKVDYLSTVSGGGYAATFYCSLFVPHPLRGAIPGQASDKAEEWSHKRAEDLGPDILGGHIGKCAMEQLREGGHFLNPNGTSDALFAVVVAFRNWLAVALITGLLLLSMFLATNIPRLADSPTLRNSTMWAAEQARIVPPDASHSPPVQMRAKPTAVHAAVICAAKVGIAPEGVSARCEVSPGTEKPKPRRSLANIGNGRLGASWVWLLVALLLPLWIVPTAWAYWLTRTAHIPKAQWWRLLSRPTLVTIAFALLLMAVLAFDDTLTRTQQTIATALLMSAIGSISVYALAEARTSGTERSSGTATSTAAVLLAEEDRVRTRLSRWLFRGVFLAAGLTAFALTDDAGRTVYHMTIRTADYPRVSFATGTLGAVATLIVPLARWLLKRAQGTDLLSWPRLGPILRRFGRSIALIAGLILLFAVLVFWSAVAYAIFWHNQPVVVTGEFAAWRKVWPVSWQPPVLITIFTALCTLILGRVHGFLNQTSLASFYAARLRKAYLGASNVDRIAGRTPADVELPTDEIDLQCYFHEAVLAPVHLINVTVNETTSESSRVIQRDRKGKGLTISPAGFVFVKDAPSTAPVGFRLSDGEQLPLSTWMGISGAAFSTGMGQHTSLGLSLLAGMTNLRLGYWWNSPHPGRWRAVRKNVSGGKRLWWAFKDYFGDLVQSYLLREVRDDYEGTHSNRWYLSDGGHFENTGIYELVRRRVPLIIACDNGADPTYEFADFVNLVRKIRIDLAAETELVSNEELDRLFDPNSSLRRVFGTLEDMGPESDGNRKGESGPYVALARIKYFEDRPETASSTLLLIKPRVAGGELPDLIRYKKSNVAFPQQPTTDLFFDETQWESYFRLGQLIAETIFKPEGERDPGKHLWRPWELKPLP